MVDTNTMIFNAACLGILVGATLSFVSTIWYRTCARIGLIIFIAINLFGGVLASNLPVVFFGITLGIGWLAEQYVRLIFKKRTGS